MMSMPRIWVVAVLVAAVAVAAMAGCKHEVEYFCNMEKPCADRYPERPYCNTSTNTCEADPVGTIDAGGGVDGPVDVDGGDVVDAGPTVDAFTGQRLVVQIVGEGRVAGAGTIDCGLGGSTCETVSVADLTAGSLVAYDKGYQDDSDPAGAGSSFLGWSVSGPADPASLDACAGWSRTCQVGPLGPWTGTVVITATFGTPGAHKWAKSFGSSADESLVAVAAPLHGNIDRVFIAGNFSGTLDLGGKMVTSDSGSLDYFVAMLNPADGTVEWAIRGGGVNHDTAFDLAATNDGDVLLIAGLECTRATSTSADCTGASSLRVVKFNGQTGSEVWTRSHVAPAGFTVSISRALIASDSTLSNTLPVDDYFAIGGSFTGSIGLGGDDLVSTGTGADMFLAWMTEAGGHQKSLSFGTSDGISADLWSLRREGEVLIASGGAGALDFGSGPLPNAGGQDAFSLTAMLDPTSTPVGSRILGLPGDEYVLYNGFDSNTDGTIVVAGGCIGQASAKGVCGGDLGLSPFVGTTGGSTIQGPWMSGKSQVAAALSLNNADPRDYVTVSGHTDRQIGFDDGNPHYGTTTGGTGWLASFGPFATPRFFVTVDSNLSLPSDEPVATSLTDHTLTRGGELIAGGHFMGALTHAGGSQSSKGLRDIVIIKVGP